MAASTSPWLPGGKVAAHAALLLTAGYIFYHIGLFAYRLSPYHPLYKFPGPRLAAATYLYEMYYDIVKGGQYMFEIKRLHGIHGMSLVNLGHSND